MRGRTLLRSTILSAVLGLAVVGVVPGTALAVSWQSYTLGDFYDIAQATDPAVRDAGKAVVFFGNATGFVISPEGHVLTNHHVYESFGTGGTVYVEWTGSGYRRSLRLALVAKSATYDVAIYKANVTNLPYLKVDPRAARVGEDVFVVGHPNSRSQEVSFGKVLATGLTIAGRPSIEYSAQTWWGSSGSPVCDRAGNVIAIHWGWDATGISNGRLTGVPFNLITQAVPEIARVVQRYGVGAVTSGTSTGTSTSGGAGTGTSTATSTGRPAHVYRGTPSLSGGGTLGRPGSAGTSTGTSTATSTGAGAGTSTGTSTAATTLRPLAVGGSETATLSGAGDLHYYRLELAARGDLTVTLAGPAGADFDLAIWKWDAAARRGVARGKADGQSADEQLTVRDATPGTYVVVVNSYSGSGAYTVSSRLAQATTVPGASGTGTLGSVSDVLQGAGDWKIYTMNADAGALRVDLAGAAGSDFDVYVFQGSRVDANAVVAVGDTQASTESVSFTAQQGTYTILVRAAAGSGQFTLTISR